MTSICLALIVKDCGDTIARCIESASPFVDRVLIVDTGSTDDTKDVVKYATDRLDLPLTLLDEPFENFAVNRTSLLAHARESGAEFTLMLDDDMTVQGTLPDQLVADEYHVTVLDRGMDYALPLLTSTRIEWKYEGVAHSYLTTEADYSHGGVLPDFKIVDHGGGPGDDGKFARDRDLFEKAIIADPNNPRNWFYLAQSYRDNDEPVKAIEAYRHRAMMDGFDEEKYFAMYQLGQLLCAHKSYSEGAEVLLNAWRFRPHRTEALRALARNSDAVADKIPYPENDVLFVNRFDYKRPDQPPGKLIEKEVALGDVLAGDRGDPAFLDDGSLDPKSVAAIIVTRGDHPAEVEFLAKELPYGEVFVWDNSKSKIDLKVFGRYTAIPLTTKPVIYWQDDDIRFTNHEELLKAYEPGKLIANMDEGWITGARYEDRVALPGAGSLCDANLPGEVWDRYFASFPFDEDILTLCDFAFGTLVPFKRVDLGYQYFEYAEGPDRIVNQPGQNQRKWAMIDRCRKLLGYEEDPTGRSPGHPVQPNPRVLDKVGA